MAFNKQSRVGALLSRASYGVLTVAAVAALGSGAAWAQTVQPPAEETTVDEVVATGFRAALQSALNVKRNADVMVDAINAEDIADFPDANLAESLQRLPGVTIDRDNGEGRTITVRGLGPDFTRVRLNGVEALSTAAANDSGTTPNRSRGFDFNTFASELFSSLKVQKSASAETDEGSLGATVDLTTGRPFNFRGRRAALSLQNAYYENGGTNSIKAAGLFSDRWMDGRMGATVSFSYSERSQITDSYSRQAAAFDFAYRGSTFAGSPNPTAASPLGGPNNWPSIMQRQGFAAPIGAACNGGSVTAPVNTAVVPGLNITNALACSTESGSDPVAYALLYPTGGAIRSRDPAAPNSISTTAPGSLVRIPGLPTLNQQQLDQTRLGVTVALQWRPSEQTLISLDGVYSKFFNNSQFFQISTIGLNRNNTVSGYNTASGATAIATRAGFYGACAAAGTVTMQCQGTEGTGAVLPGYFNSTNPNNLNAFDYYNNAASVGYVASANGMAMIDRLIGRPSTRLIEAHLSGNDPATPTADYLKLGNIDYRSADDQNFYTTLFNQGSITLDHEFSSRLRFQSVYGSSSSTNKSTGLLADLIRLDSGDGTAGNGYFVFDDRGGGPMPIMDFGFDAADPTKWDTVKGYSVLRVQTRFTQNKYNALRGDFTYEINDAYDLKFGGASRQYNFATTELRRASNEAVSPTLLEGGSTVAATGRVINWGAGLDVPAGTTTSFWAPDNAAFVQLFGFDCNCVNRYGDFRQVINGASNNQGLNFAVSERDTGGYMQLNFDSELFGLRFRGNVGSRYALTQVSADGFTLAGTPLANSHRYIDNLPSMNAALELNDQMMIRFGAADVMSRPLLAQLAPGITAFTVPSTVGATTGGAITMGNTKLSPFRARNYDVAYEWYFARGALFGVAFFQKDVHSFPQTIVSDGVLSDFLDADTIAAIRATLPGTAAGDAQRAYIDSGQSFNFRQPRDAPGGYIRGYEINYQQDLTFLPGVFQYFGVQANYTHIESELNYILDPGQTTIPVRAATIGTGPFLGASPDSINFTVYYEAPKWSARVSTAYRAEYFQTYPVAAGTCEPGFCDGPTINDFAGSRATTNVDASFTYKLTPKVTLTAEALNITNQTTNRFAYQGDNEVTQYASTGRQFFIGLRATY